MPTKLNQPVIVISGSSPDSASVQAAAAMISGAGAVPLILTNHLGRVRGKDRAGLYEEVHRILKKADGVLVMGNDLDIDASEYGQANGAKTNSQLLKKDGSVNEEGMARRNYEMALLRTAMGAGMPVVGVCAGGQRINLLCGGDLIQHVPDAMRDAQHSEHAQLDLGIPLFIPVQPVEIKHDSTLGGIAEEIQTVFTPARTCENDIRLDVNSMHHQAVGKVGEGLRIAATAEDVLKDGSKLIEAIEADPHGKYGKQFLIGVQWHPEFSDSPLGAKISQHFTAAAKEYAKLTNREHTLEEVQEENRLSALPALKAPEAGAVVRVGSMTEKIINERAARDPSFGMAV